MSRHTRRGCYLYTKRRTYSGVIPAHFTHHTLRNGNHAPADPHFFKFMNALTTQLYPSLLRQAGCLLVGTSAAFAMQPADLLHAAVEKICRSGMENVIGESAAFSGLVRTVMQRTIIDEHRRSIAARRPPPARSVPLDEAGEIPAPEDACAAAEEVHHALRALAARDPDAARVVRGLFMEEKTFRELAAELRVSPSTVSRRWTTAAAWLRRELCAA